MSQDKTFRPWQGTEELLKTVMKRFAIVCLHMLALVLSQAPSQVCAQSTTPPITWWSSGFPVQRTNGWWTNQTRFTNRSAPPKFSTNNTHGIISPGQTPSATLPNSVQTLLQQFQQQRNQLMNNIQGLTEEQRQAVLGQLQQLRDQLQSQLQAITDQAREQAVNMRSQFGGHFAPGGSSGGGPGSSGHGGRPRN